MQIFATHTETASDVSQKWSHNNSPFKNNRIFKSGFQPSFHSRWFFTWFLFDQLSMQIIITGRFKPSFTFMTLHKKILYHVIIVTMWQICRSLTKPQKIGEILFVKKMIWNEIRRQFWNLFFLTVTIQLAAFFNFFFVSDKWLADCI